MSAPEASRPRASIVIPSKNGADTLPELLGALRRQRTDFDWELVVVDSGSTDGSLDLLHEFGARIDEIPPSEFNHGATRNRGIAQTNGEIIVLLTQDALPQGEHFLAAIVDAFDDETVAGVYGRQIPRSDADVVTKRHLGAWLTGRSEPARSERGEQPLESLSPYERYELCVFDNVCSAIRRAVWEKHPFDAAFFAEDIGWSKEVIEAGWAVEYIPSAAVVHSHRRPLLEEYARTRMCHHRLHELFGLATLPRRRDLPRAMLYNLRNDLPYVFREAPGAVERIRQLARVAGLSVLGPLAQNRGIRDAQRLGRGEPAR